VQQLDVAWVQSAYRTRQDPPMAPFSNQIIPPKASQACWLALPQVAQDLKSCEQQPLADGGSGVTVEEI
jgi:hypothetical protein